MGLLDVAALVKVMAAMLTEIKAVRALLAELVRVNGGNPEVAE